MARHYRTTCRYCHRKDEATRLAHFNSRVTAHPQCWIDAGGDIAGLSDTTLMTFSTRTCVALGLIDDGREEYARLKLAERLAAEAVAALRAARRAPDRRPRAREPHAHGRNHVTTNVNPRGGDLLRALQHSLFTEETRMSLTITPPPSVIPSAGASRSDVPKSRDLSSLFDAKKGPSAALRLRHSRSECLTRDDGGGKRPRMPHSLYAADETTLTAAGAAWLARQPLPSDHPDSVRARMASEIARAVSAGGSIGERDLTRAGFTPAQVESHFDAALDASGVRGFE